MKREQPRGQVVVWVAVLLVVLLLFVGLAVDVGAGLAQRRQMQNAADAGALAGAHQLCFGSRANAVAAATDYAQRNGAQSPVTVEIRNEAGEVDATNGYIVWVRAASTMNATLLSILGVHYNVGASAAAACGVATASCGLWPLTFKESVWQGNCGRVIYVWNDAQDNTGLPDPDKAIDCSVQDCDLDDDGIWDIVAGEGRGWVDFSDSEDPLYKDLDGCIQTGCGASEMSCLIDNASNDRVILPTCLPGVGGVKQSVVADAIDQQGERVKIPVFDYVGCEAGRSCPNGGTYHITNFGCGFVEPPLSEFEMAHLCAKKKADRVYPCYDADASPSPIFYMTESLYARVLRVMVDCSNCTTECGATAGGPPPPDGGTVVAVSLIE